MSSVPNVALLFHHAIEELCENFSAIAYCVVKLQLVKVKELDVCVSLVFGHIWLPSYFFL